MTFTHKTEIHLRRKIKNDKIIEMKENKSGVRYIFHNDFIKKIEHRNNTVQKASPNIH